jgi:hypothetical protein
MDLWNLQLRIIEEEKMLVSPSSCGLGVADLKSGAGLNLKFKCRVTKKLSGLVDMQLRSNVSLKSWELHVADC